MTNFFHSNLKPWLIEVNAAPSLTANTKEDYELKFTMLDTMYDMIDVERKHPGASIPRNIELLFLFHNNLSGLLESDRYGGFDCIYRAGEIIRHPTSTIQSFLGCAIPAKKKAEASPAAKVSVETPKTASARGFVRSGSARLRTNGRGSSRTSSKS